MAKTRSGVRKKAPAKPVGSAKVASAKKAAKKSTKKKVVAAKKPASIRKKTPSKSGLAPADQRLVRLSAAVCLGNWSALKDVRSSATKSEPDRAWREAVLQCHLFCGFPRVVEAYGVLRKLGGLGDMEADEVRGENDQPGRGGVLFDHIYREQADGIRALLNEAHPDFAAWIAGHAYGRVLTRPGLAAVKRELCAVACLAALGQERQLASHVRGSLRCGATAGQVRGVLEAISDLIEEATAQAARGVIERFSKL